MAALWATGELWLRVPEAVCVTLPGHLNRGVTAKDISLKIIQQWGSNGASNFKKMPDVLLLHPAPNFTVILSVASRWGRYGMV